MTQNEFLDSLTLEEARYIISQFYHWHGDAETGCPRMENSDYPCIAAQDGFKIDKDDEYEYDLYECPYEQCGCWAEYYLWKYRQQDITQNKSRADEGMKLLESIGNARFLEEFKKLKDTGDEYIKAREEFSRKFGFDPIHGIPFSFFKEHDK